MSRRTLAAFAFLASLAVTGCTGDSASEPPAGRTSQPSPSTSPSPTKLSAPELARDIFGDTSWDAAPTTTPITVTSGNFTFEVAVDSLTTSPDQSVLTLKVRSPGKSAIGAFYGVENRAAWRDLNQLSIDDDTSKMRFFPYRYQFLPDGPQAKEFGSTGHDEPWMPADRWITLAGLVLPPLPEGATSVKVNIPTSLNSSEGRGTVPIGTIDAVHVTRAAT